MTPTLSYIAGAYAIGIVSILGFRVTTHLRLSRAQRKLEALHES